MCGDSLPILVSGGAGLRDRLPRPTVTRGPLADSVRLLGRAAVWRTGPAILGELARADAAARLRHDESLKETSTRLLSGTPEPPSTGRGCG